MNIAGSALAGSGNLPHIVHIWFFPLPCVAGWHEQGHLCGLNSDREVGILFLKEQNYQLARWSADNSDKRGMHSKGTLLTSSSFPEGKLDSAIRQLIPRCISVLIVIWADWGRSLTSGKEDVKDPSWLNSRWRLCSGQQFIYCFCFLQINWFPFEAWNCGWKFPFPMWCLHCSQCEWSPWALDWARIRMVIFTTCSWGLLEFL